MVVKRPLSATNPWPLSPTSFPFLWDAALRSDPEGAAFDAGTSDAVHAGAALATAIAVKITAATIAAIARRWNIVTFAEIIFISP
jgi:hypothetical protein